MFLVSQTLVDLDEGHNAARFQSVSGCLAIHLAVHRALKQDRTDDLATAKAWRGDNAAAHFMDATKHLLIAVPLTVFDAVTAQSLWRGATRLVERCNKALAAGHLLFHFIKGHGHWSGLPALAFVLLEQLCGCFYELFLRPRLIALLPNCGKVWRSLVSTPCQN